MIFIRKITKGHNSAKIVVEFWFSFSAYSLILVFIFFPSVIKISGTVSVCYGANTKS